MSIKKFACNFVFLFSICSIFAQQINTLYFLENTPQRNYLNPAFIPVNQFYINLPVVGYSTMNAGNNSLKLSDLIYKANNQTITFLHPDGNIDQFYNNLQSTTIFRSDFQTTLLGFGFKNKNQFYNFSVNTKLNALIGIPRDFFKLSLYGTPTLGNNSYKLTTLQTDLSAYTEFALGYSKKLKNEKWIVGSKLKFLIGTGNLSITNSSLKMDASMDRWKLTGNGTINYSSPIELKHGDKILNYNALLPKKISDWLVPSGYGAAMDAGVEYRYNEKFHFSAALCDVGFIHWKKNTQNIHYSTNYVFDGVAHITPDMDINTIQNMYSKFTKSNALLDSLNTAFLNASNITNTTQNFYTATTAKLNIGAEYYAYSNYLTIGILSRTLFLKKTMTEELTASVNVRPVEWFNSSLSYSLLNGTFSSFGAGIGVRTGFMHWFVAADYLPLFTTKLLLSDLNTNYSNSSITLPYKSKNYNVSLGISIILGEYDQFANTARANRERGLYNSTSHKSNPRTNTNIRKPNKKGRMKPEKLKNNCHCEWKES